ncbi:MAG: hypothetical protein VX737_03425 [Pseudomonadota bacterium]|nr:hypothetical protein [Pseudomonadota bacterium]
MKEFLLKFALKIWYAISLIPRKWQYKLASMLGKISLLFSKRRANIIRKNLSWCFAHQTKDVQTSLFNANIRFLGQSFFDTGVAWFWSDAAIKSHIPHHIKGLDAFLEAQKSTDKGILLLGKHSQHLELDARILGLYVTGYGVSRGSDSPALNAAMNHGRQKASVDMSAKTNPRQFVRWLKEGKTVVYFPDQDYGKKRSIETSLLGTPATFTTAPYTLHRLSNCLIYFYNTYYENNTLVIDIQPLDLPTHDCSAFTLALAKIIEQSISKHPAEYLWAHRRFKSTKGKESYSL